MVAEPGSLRVIEFTKTLSLPTAKFTVAAVIKAIVDANYPNLNTTAPFKIQKPKTAVMLETSQLSKDSIVTVKEELLKQVNIELITEEEMRNNPTLLDQYNSQVPKTNARPGNLGMQANGEPPLRGCHVCHNDIPGKASQCSACKAIIYCGKECAVNIFNY